MTLGQQVLKVAMYWEEEFKGFTCRKGGLGSVVGIATAYGVDGPGIESRWGEIFRTSPDRP